MNEEIRVPVIRLIDEHGQQLGIFQVRDALRIAADRELDLIEIVPKANPPVCKIVQFGKFKFELQKKEKLARKSQQSKQLKEVQIHPNIDTHDIEFKARHAREFLADGNKVKVNLIFKGREMTYIENGRTVMQEFISKLADVGKVEVAPKMEGKQMHAIIAPLGVAKKPAPAADKKDKPKPKNNSAQTAAVKQEKVEPIKDADRQQAAAAQP
jgi:translation initiation factor IF-3